MNTIDATDRTENKDEAESPSLLTVILDTNPHAWALLADSLRLSDAVANLLVFINAHLAINHANRVAVLASHAERAEWLYPTAPKQHSLNGQVSDGADVSMSDVTTSTATAHADANKYRSFAQVEQTLLENLQNLMDTTSQHALSSAPSTMTAGALTLALSYISKQTANLPAATMRTQFNYSDPSSVAGGNELSGNRLDGQPMAGLTSRILVVSVSGDLAHQYIPIMNAVFACQRLSIPIDILKLAGDTVFLQQAADATGGVYMSLNATTRKQLLQYLMFAYLPDRASRKHLILPGEGDGVDFRAACFCHRKIVDIGYVCSICLSIFCEPLQDNICLTCGSHLSIGNFGKLPVVVPKKKKRRKRPLDGNGADTPASGRSTPAPA